MKKVLLTICIASSLSLLAAVEAQEGAQDRGEVRKRILRVFDKDGDGRLSAEERESLRQFVRSRRDGNGGVGSDIGRMPEPKPEKLTNLYGSNLQAVPLTQKDYNLEDSARNKTLQFRATFAADKSGKLPVIVWSHGMYGSQDFYKPLVEHWAAHGYLVLQPTHSDSLRRGSGLKNPTSDWMSRPLDVSFLLDSIASHEDLGKRADLQRVGMGGHSYGAHTTLLVNGAEPNFGRNYADSRPKAFLAISPQGDNRLLSGDSWLGLKRPTLFISGDNDKTRHGESAITRRIPYDQASPGEKYLLWIKDAHHNFGGISGARHSGSGPANGDQVALVKSATLAFWDSYLKGEPKAQTLIRTGAFGPQSQGLATWSAR